MNPNLLEAQRHFLLAQQALAREIQADRQGYALHGAMLMMTELRKLINNVEFWLHQ